MKEKKFRQPWVQFKAKLPWHSASRSTRGLDSQSKDASRELPPSTDHEANLEILQKKVPTAIQAKEVLAAPLIIEPTIKPQPATAYASSTIEEVRLPIIPTERAPIAVEDPELYEHTLIKPPEFKTDPQMGQIWDDAARKLVIETADYIIKEGDNRVYEVFGIKFERAPSQSGVADSAEELWLPKGPLPAPDVVISKLNPDLPSNAAHQRYSHVKEIFLNILEWVQNIGALVAKAASLTFPPSEICFTAFCHLLNTVQRYHQYFMNLSELFESISRFLYRFKIYCRDKPLGYRTDDALLNILKELLGCFVEICTYSVKITGIKKRREKVKLAAGLMLTGDDTTLRDLLTRITNLSMWELQQNVAEILGTSIQMASKVDKIESRSAKQDEMNYEAKMLKDIAEALGVKENDSWVKVHKECIRTRTSSTGDWLLMDPKFQAWSTAEDDSGPHLFALEASGSFGKTYLCSRAIYHLRSKYVHNAGTLNTHVGYFFFDGIKKSGVEFAVRDAMASLIVQLAQTDTYLLKFVHDLLPKTELEQDRHLEWCNIFVRYGTRYENTEDKDTIRGKAALDNPVIASQTKMNEAEPPNIGSEDTKTTGIPTTTSLDTSRKTTTYYLVLDGINNIREGMTASLHKLVKNIAEQSCGVLRLKLLISGDEPSLLPMISAPVPCTTIKISDRNGPDLKAFIRKRLEDNRWPANGPLANCGKHIEITLMKRDPDFRAVNSILTQIAIQHTELGINRILAEESTVASAIKKLESELDAEGLEDFNELLPWIVLPKYWPDLDQIVAVLSLRRGQDIIVPSYDNYLRTTYPAPLLKIDGDVVKSHETMEYFENPTNQVSLSGKNAMSSKGVVIRKVEPHIHPSEISLLKNILKQLCEKELYKRFEFEEFFKSKAIIRAITFSPVDGHLRIMIACMKALGTKTPNGNSQALHMYAITYLVEHLQAVVKEDLADASESRKQDFGTLLHDLFTNDAYMEIWLSSDYFTMVESFWIKNDAMQQSILKFFEHADLNENALQDRKLWLHRINSNPGDLYNESAKFMAKKWLQEDEWGAEDAFNRLQTFYSNVISCDRPLYIMTRTIQDLVDWAGAKLDACLNDPLSFTRVAETMLAYSQYGGAVEYCDQALEKDNNYWKARWYSIRASRETAEPDSLPKVAGSLKNLIIDLQDKSRTFSANEDAIWKKILVYARALSEDLDDMEQAVAYAKQLQKTDPKDNNATYAVIELMLKTKDFSSIVAFLEDLSASSGSYAKELNSGTELLDGENDLTSLFQYFAESDSFHHGIACMIQMGKAQDHDITQLIERTFASAVKLTTDNARARMYLRYYHGLLSYYNSSGTNDILEAIALWETNIREDDPLDGTSIDMVRNKSVRKVITAYLDLCKLQPEDADPKDEHLKALLKLQKKRPGVFDRSENSLIARLYQSSIKSKNEAKKQIEPYIIEALTLLSDSIPGNDWYGFKLLAQVLSSIDTTNALAAWTMIRPYRRSELSTDSDSDDNSHRGTASPRGQEPKQLWAEFGPLWGVTCDGNCGHHWTFASEMYYCQECIDTKFDKKCYDKLLNDTLNWRVCKKGHDFVHIPEWNPEAVAHHTQDQIQVGEELITIKEWVSRLKDEYCPDADLT